MTREGISVENKQVFLAHVRQRLADLRPPVDVLEAGFGVGGVTEQVLTMLGSTDTYTGVDLNAECAQMVQELIEASAHRERCRLVVGDMCTMAEVADDSADVVISDTAINLVHWRLPQAFAEFRRVLRPGGQLVLRELQPADVPAGTQRDAFYRTMMAARLLVGLPYLMVPARVVEALLRNAGFDDIRIELTKGNDPKDLRAEHFYPFGESDFTLSATLLEALSRECEELPSGGALSDSYTVTAVAH